MILEVGKYGILRACADDLGAVINNIQALKFMDPVFVHAKKAANLSVFFLQDGLYSFGMRVLGSPRYRQ